MSHLEPALEEHFCTNVLTCASRLQSTGPANDKAHPAPIAVSTPDQFGKELLKCIKGLPAAKVLILIHCMKGEYCCVCLGSHLFPNKYKI